MWRDVAPLLAQRFTIIAADLPGYGDSAIPPDGGSSESMSKRGMATTLVEAMAALGHARVAIAGHDRGGRVAYRAAFDHPDIVTKVAVLDVIPTAALWSRADARLMQAFWPFSFLAQPSPLPERLIGGDPEAVIDDACTQWDTPPETFPEAVRAAYAEALRDPANVHAICEEYRAAATIDREHDEADLQYGRKIAAPLLALWSSVGGLEKWYAKDGGPLAIWSKWASDVSGQAVDGGHFFPEEYPERTAQQLADFFA